MSRKNIIFTMTLLLSLVVWVCAAPSASAQQADDNPPKKSAVSKPAPDRKPPAQRGKADLDKRLERLEKAVRQLRDEAGRNRRQLDTDRPGSEERGGDRVGRRGGRGTPSAEGQGRRRAGRNAPQAEGRGSRGDSRGPGAVRRGAQERRPGANSEGTQRRRAPARKLGEWARENPEKAMELRERLQNKPEAKERFHKKMQELRQDQAGRRAPSRGQDGAGRRFQGAARRPHQDLERAEALRGRLEQRHELKERLREQPAPPPKAPDA